MLDRYLKQLPALQYLEMDSSVPEKKRRLPSASYDTVLRMLFYKPDKPYLLKSMELLLWERDKEEAFKFNSRYRQILVNFFCLVFIKEFPGSGPRLCTFSNNLELVDSFAILLQHLSRKHV